MHLLYLDESGGAKEKDQNFYVLGGVSAFERRPYFITEEMNDLQKRIFPNATDPIEFHSSAIRNGNGPPWDSMPRKDRLAVLNSVYELLAQMTEKVELFAVAFDKRCFPSDDPVQRTCEEISGHFDALLARLETDDPKHGKQMGLMIFDECNHRATLHALMAQYRSTGASWGKVRHLAEIPMFTDSRLTRMLQIADFVAYAVFRRYEHGDSQFLDKIIHRFDQSGGILHGLAHLCTNRQTCFCPACASRR
jgi:hypothetical protein